MSPRKEVITPAILAVDGGNTKTDVVLLDRVGRVAGAARGPGSFRQTLEGRVQTLAAAVAAASRSAGIEPGNDSIAELGVYCLAGADLPSDWPILRRLLNDRGWTVRSVIENDTMAVFRTGSRDGWGIALVCGTGINCAGTGPDGRRVRFPSLGLLSGEWGGGYDVGLAALGAAIRGRDGRGPRTLLERLVPHYFSLSNPLAVVEALHRAELEEARLAELSPVVFEAVAQGDEAAQQILRRLEGEVIAMAASAIRRLRLVRREFDVILGGGLLQRTQGTFVENVYAGIRTIAPLARIEVLSDAPVVGAALLGLDHLAAEPIAHDRLRGADLDRRLGTTASLTDHTYSPPSLHVLE